jgi:hypothetical protein
MIWCYDCKVDTQGDGGIFDGPIPMGIAGLFGISFDRIHIRTGKILKMKILDRKLIWKFDK